MRVACKNCPAEVLGQHPLILVYGSRKNLKELVCSPGWLDGAAAHVSWVSKGRLTFKPLPWSRSSPAVSDSSDVFFLLQSTELALGPFSFITMLAAATAPPPSRRPARSQGLHVLLLAAS